MSFLAMAKEKAYLTLCTKEGMSAGPLASIIDIVERSRFSKDLRPYLADDVQSLFNVFSSLVRNEGLRREVGALWKLACSESSCNDVDLWRKFLFE